MFFGKTRKRQGRIDSLIGAGTRIDGNVTFVGGLRIDGRVHGNVVGEAESSSTLVVSEHGVVEGEVRASHCVINGSVAGPIHAVEFLELQAGARVTGDVTYSNLEMHKGAAVEGRLVRQVTPERALKLASSH